MKKKEKDFPEDWKDLFRQAEARRIEAQQRREIEDIALEEEHLNVLEKYNFKPRAYKVVAEFSHFIGIPITDESDGFTDSGLTLQKPYNTDYPASIRITLQTYLCSNQMQIASAILIKCFQSGGPSCEAIIPINEFSEELLARKLLGVYRGEINEKVSEIWLTLTGTDLPYGKYEYVKYESKREQAKREKQRRKRLRKISWYKSRK